MCLSTKKLPNFTFFCMYFSKVAKNKGFSKPKKGLNLFENVKIDGFGKYISRESS